MITRPSSCFSFHVKVLLLPVYLLHAHYGLSVCHVTFLMHGHHYIADATTDRCCCIADTARHSCHIEPVNPQKHLPCSTHVPLISTPPLSFL
jgi:hypothetical protein